MEHISTLCAASTVGIAATGLAFGRVDQTAPKFGRFRRKTLPRHEVSATTNAIDSKVSAVKPSRTPPPTNLPSSPNPRDAGSFAALNGVLAEQNPSPRRRSLLFAPVRLCRRGTLTSPSVHVPEKELQVSHVRHPSSDWLQQISPVSNQAAENRGATSVSPTSNGRVSPALSRFSSQRRAPNKLVKRPPPIHSNAHHPSGRPSLSAITSPTFRGPATSHQRSGGSRHKATHSLNFEPGSFTYNPVLETVKTPEPPNDVSCGLRPYLTSTVDGLPERLARKLSTVATKDYGLRRILPRASAAPTLVLGTSIASKQPVPDTAVGQCPTPTTPATPATPISPLVHFRDPFQSMDVPVTPPETPFEPEKQDYRPSVSFEEPNPPSVQGADSSGAEKPPGGSLVYSKRRAVSTSLLELERVSPGSYDEKRNITDPSELRQSLAGAVKRSHRTLPLSSVSRGFRARMGSAWDPMQCPATSDQVTLSSLQNGSSRQLESKNSSTRQRPRRHSVAASDPASTVISSDDTRVFTSGEEEDDTSFISDTAFDSIRTHLTKNSNAGRRGPRIETIFDSVPSMGLPNEEPTKLENYVSRSPFVPQQPSIDKSPISDSHHIPQEIAGPRGEGTSRSSLLSDITDDEDVRSLVAALPGASFPSTRLSSLLPDEVYSHQPDDSFALDNEISFSSTPWDSRNTSKETLEPPKMNIFDWSEKPRNDREVSGSESRPRTVHGKQGPEARCSRAPGRGAPSTLHLRSQSVPVSRDPSLSSDSRQSSGKFGTWGLGSKGASEDWDDDFDFEEEDDGNIGEAAESGKNLVSRGMTVPKSIMDRQASLHGQFGQVQELTLLVEELKRLRHQASVLDLAHGPSSELWKEAQGIVNLATVDEDENRQSPPRSPSSLTFSFDDTDDEEFPNLNDRPKRPSRDSYPASISEELESDTNPHSTQEEYSPAKAKSVLDLIYQRRNSTCNDAPNPRPKKLAFDTQSLRDLVVRAGVVTRALKEVIRKAEGVSTSPDKEVAPADPPFSRIFRQPSNGHDDAFTDLD